MSSVPKPHRSPEEYLALEREADFKSEYFDGEVFAMSGASEHHNLIAANVIRELGNQLKRRPCKVYPSDMRVKVSATGLYTYPDVVVVCGEAAFDDAQRDTLVNPTVLVEVLSGSTEAYDRGKKAEHYRRLPSLQAYVLVAQHEPQLEHYARQPDGRWLLSEAHGLEASIDLPSIQCTLELAEVYDKVVLGDQTLRP
jgi:Uma2 family endonuclease